MIWISPLLQRGVRGDFFSFGIIKSPSFPLFLKGEMYNSGTLLNVSVKKMFYKTYMVLHALHVNVVWVREGKVPRRKG